MARWEPNPQQRLQEAAWTLFLERGYGVVTVADIAERAGLTKRSFFNHYADKREVLFAGSRAFEATVVEHLAGTDPAMNPVDAAVAALTTASVQDLKPYVVYAGARRELIASSIELQERDLIKTASLTAAIAAGLRDRHAAEKVASFAAKTAVAVFSAAYDDWTDEPAADFSALMAEALAGLRRTVCSL